ncbi:MAG: hypothetical protein JW910_10925, partial [Anaerolineae bacterium]|nr:hypothetical protein [Anaerolineae bacterium]
GRKEPKEIWLLTGAWFLGASMNAIMTWWAVGSALAANPGLGNELLTRQQILDYAPVFIAILVWFTRILIIGTFAFAGDHIFSTAHPANSRDTVNGTASPARRFGFGRQAAARVTSASARTRAVPKPNATPSLPPREQPRPSPLPAYASTRETNEYRTGSSSYRAGNTSYRAADDDNGPRRHDNRDSARYGADARATSRSPFGYGSGYSQSGYSQPGYGQATSPAASIRQNTPTSGGSRASSVRTLGTAPSAPTAASQAASLPVQASMELEYVDVT